MRSAASFTRPVSPRGKVVLVNEITESAEVPRRFLSRIFQPLAKLGLEIE